MVNLEQIARQVMKSYDFLTDAPVQVLAEAQAAKEPVFEKLPVRDLSAWLWSSIDNDDSKDLDQIEYAAPDPKGTRLYVGIAHVDGFAPKGSATDAFAQHNTTSLYTGVKTFPMLPEKLSTDLSSLVEGKKRLAVVVEILVNAENHIEETSVYPAIVFNRAQLTYNAVSVWLGDTPASQVASDVTTRMLAKITSHPELQGQLRLQDRVAQGLRLKRHEAGALSFASTEFRPEILPDGRIELKPSPLNRATQLIEDFMIAANQATAAFLESKGFPSLRRIVRTPKRWDRIVALAADHGGPLPAAPDSKALENFLVEQQRKDPDHFPDLSLAIIKLLGRGEYLVKAPGQQAPGHFGLAVENYSHSTAPNRRYPDLLTQRLILAANQGSPSPYPFDELQRLAQYCTQKEDDANKVERTVRKSIAAVALSPRIGESFDAFITGVSDKGVWARLLHPPVEGKIQGKTDGLDVGDPVTVRLMGTNPLKVFIDFQVVATNPAKNV